LKPENILFDGSRVWLVDWEAAFLNDRYFDLAMVANFVVTNDAEENAFLQTYFGEPLLEYKLDSFCRLPFKKVATIPFRIISFAHPPPANSHRITFLQKT
jgi:hypothetical protein